jgi:Fe-S cluster biogenesis protein NfuA
MALMDMLVSQILDEVRPTLARDGGDVKLLSCADGVVRVAYAQGKNDECEDCVMSLQDFQMYLEELFQERVQGVECVEVLGNS